jgi:predicted metal-dependent hydrolase
MQYTFGQFGPEQLVKMEEGVRLFNEQMYWECHESLEEIWIEDKQDPARNVYWAVIQVAATCIHYRDDKIIGAQGMINKAREKFKRCRDQHILTDLAFKYLDWEELEGLVVEIKDKEAVLEDFAKLYDFRFKNYQSHPE